MGTALSLADGNIPMDKQLAGILTRQIALEKELREMQASISAKVEEALVKHSLETATLHDHAAKAVLALQIICDRIPGAQDILNEVVQ